MTKRIAPLFVLLTFFVWSCDLFEDDVVPGEKEITLGQTDFYTVPNAPAVIDLKSLVKSYSQVSLTITDQPSHGGLQKIADAVFEYRPDVDFKGKDYFLFDIKSNGVSVLKDSITITISQDTTGFPCGLYAVHDSVTILYTTFPHFGVDISVLDNDRVCGIDKTDVIVSIFSAPSHGEAGVTETLPMEIRYTADTGFGGDDHFVYKISDASDTSVYSLALVTVSVVGKPIDSCISIVDPDSVNLPLNGASTQIEIKVLDNDTICNGVKTLTIADAPGNGTAIVEGHSIYYMAESQTSPSDSLTYRVCNTLDSCAIGRVYIRRE